MRKISKGSNGSALFLCWMLAAVCAFVDASEPSAVSARTKDGVNTTVKIDSTVIWPNLIFPAKARSGMEADSSRVTPQTTPSTPDSGQAARRKIVTADSARIVSPAVRTIIAEPATYEIEPLIPVDSARLFVTYSGTSASKRTDELGTFTSPPYRAVWDNSGIPDQDQIHLQFGYRLYSGDSLVINSPPMPHRWMLDRGSRGSSSKTYKVKQAAQFGGTLEVDGDLSKWANVRGDSVLAVDGGAVARFKMLCTGARLHFIIEVLDDNVTPGDFVELHLDMNRNRASFADINHRTLRFGPLTRSMSFVSDLTRDGFAQTDSVNALMNEEKEWKAVITDSGYVIEAAMPFVILSDIGAPRARFGFNVSVMNDDPGRPALYHSWTAGADGQYFRYSPSGWGTARVSQTANALKLMMMGIIFLTCAAVVFFAGHAIFTEHRKTFHDPLENDDYSPVTNAVIEAIEDNLANADIKIGDIVKIVNKPGEEIIAALKKDMDITFEQLLIFRRLKRSQKLMREPEITIEEIAKKCGFADTGAYRQAFKAQMKVDPEISLKAMRDKVMEEERERLEDEEDD